MMANLTLLSVNVRGIRDRNKRKRVFQWAKSKGGDLILLQETYSTPDVEDTWKRDWDGQMIFSHGSNHSRGVLILVGSNVNLKVDQVVTDDEGRYIFLKGNISDFKFVLGCVYFPTRDKERQQGIFLEKIDSCIGNLQFPDHSLLIGGDFNVILDENLDYMGTNLNRRSKFNNSLKMFLRKHDLIDIWREKHPDLKQFTFRQRVPLVQSRLDYWFISNIILNKVNKCDIMTSVTPDHSSIALELLNIKIDNPYGRSYWKFNSSLCLDKNFVKGMVNEIKTIIQQWAHEFDSKSLFWDFLKMKMRQFAITYSKEKVKDRKNKIDSLEAELKVLERNLIIGACKVEDIEDKKNQLKCLYDSAVEGLKVRSRAAWYEEGEKNKGYFDQLLKCNKRKTIITELYNEKGEVSSDKDSILRVIRSFYENLYSKNQSIVDGNHRELFFTNTPRLDEESRELCEGKINREECYEALKEMKMNKSPGNDGFTVEFYVTFWPHIRGILVEALNEAYDKGFLAPSQRQGVITLIEKEGKDPLSIKNYRPITLLNVDYKILSKVLAKRMKEVLGEIVHADQVGYMKNRNIGEAIRLIDDVIYHCKNHNQDGFLVAVDFEKAFDSVSHTCLLHVLELLGFGQSFCSWVKTIYTDICSCVMNGGSSSGYFKIERGVRQGDPLLPYFFSGY